MDQFKACLHFAAHTVPTGKRQKRELHLGRPAMHNCEPLSLEICSKKNVPVRLDTCMYMIQMLFGRRRSVLASHTDNGECDFAPGFFNREEAPQSQYFVQKKKKTCSNSLQFSIYLIPFWSSRALSNPFCRWDDRQQQQQQQQPPKPLLLFPVTAKMYPSSHLVPHKSVPTYPISAKKNT